jgi:poly(3-hydroxybutyrate) depolymerase
MAKYLKSKSFLSVVAYFVLCILTSCENRICMNNACAAEPQKKVAMYNTKVMQYQGREFRLYIPASLKPGVKVPMVVVLHGGLGNAAGIESTLGMNAIAGQKGFVVAYLNGTEGWLSVMKDKRTWNAGDCCGIAVKQNIDDVGYIAGFIADMIAKNPVDPERVYLMGHSNGAMMSYRFVCEKPGIVAAMVSVSGTFTTNSCGGLNGLPVLEIHGAKDQNIPVQGGVGENSITNMNYRSVAQTADSMRQAGANFVAKIIPNGGHNVVELSSAIKVSDSMTLADMVAQFFAGKKKK